MEQVRDINTASKWVLPIYINNPDSIYEPLYEMFTAVYGYRSIANFHEMQGIVGAHQDAVEQMTAMHQRHGQPSIRKGTPVVCVCSLCTGSTGNLSTTRTNEGGL